MESLITADQILSDPAVGEPVADGAVLVRDGVIVAVGPRERVEGVARAEASRVSFPGATVLPGLIDCHVHLSFDASRDPVSALGRSDVADLLLGMVGRARQLLDTGVTTVRDLGDRDFLTLRLRDAIGAGQLAGPRILAAGPPLTPPGGHCWFLGGEVRGETALRAAVREHAERGVDLIKVMVTGGGLTPSGPAIWQSQFSTAELRAVVAEAGAAGLPVAAHAHGTEGIAAAVAAGVDTIEHCTWLTDGGFDVRPELVTEIVAREIAVCPTASPNWRGFARRFGSERAAELFDRVRWMAERGVRLVAGTDGGVPGAVFDDFVGSMEFFHHLGLPADHVLRLATTDAARALRISADTGRLAPGYRADLLVVDGDPLQDLEALRAVRLVVTGGRPHVPPRAVVSVAE